MNAAISLILGLLDFARTNQLNREQQGRIDQATGRVEQTASQYTPQSLLDLAGVGEGDFDFMSLAPNAITNGQRSPFNFYDLTRQTGADQIPTNPHTAGRFFSSEDALRDVIGDFSAIEGPDRGFVLDPYSNARVGAPTVDYNAPDYSDLGAFRSKSLSDIGGGRSQAYGSARQNLLSGGGDLESAASQLDALQFAGGQAAQRSALDVNQFIEEQGDVRGRETAAKDLEAAIKTGEFSQTSDIENARIAMDQVGRRLDLERERINVGDLNERNLLTRGTQVGNFRGLDEGKAAELALAGVDDRTALMQQSLGGLLSLLGYTNEQEGRNLAARTNLVNSGAGLQGNLAGLLAQTITGYEPLYMSFSDLWNDFMNTQAARDAAKGGGSRGSFGATVGIPGVAGVGYQS